MIVMAMSEEDACGFEFEAKNFCGDEVGVVARVDDKATGGVLVPD